MEQLLRRTISIAAGDTVNIFAGELVERFGVNLLGQFGIQASAAGMELDLTLGGNMVSVGQEIGTLNRFPTREELDFTDIECYSGTLNRCSVRNTTAGALTVFVFFKGTLRPIGVAG